MTPSELAAMVDRLAPLATEGPWEWHNSDNPDNRYFIGDHGDMCISVESMGSDYRDADPEAVALVPDLMAENQRMRRELEALRDGLEWNGTQIGSDQNEQVAFEVHGEVARTLTDILEGES